MSDHQITPITEIHPTIQHVEQPSPRQSLPSIVWDENGRPYRLELNRPQPISFNTFPRFEGLWIGLIFVGIVGVILVFLQALKPTPQPAPVIVQPQPHITNPNCFAFCN